MLPLFSPSISTASNYLLFQTIIWLLARQLVMFSQLIKCVLTRWPPAGCRTCDPRDMLPLNTIYFPAYSFHSYLQRYNLWTIPTKYFPWLRGFCAVAKVRWAFHWNFSHSMGSDGIIKERLYSGCGDPSLNCSSQVSSIFLSKFSWSFSLTSFMVLVLAKFYGHLWSPLWHCL